MAPPKRVLAELAIGMAFRYAPKAVPPRPRDQPFSLGSVAVSAVVGDVGFFMVDAPVVIGPFEESVPAEVVGIDPASGLYVPNRQTNERSLTRVRLQFKPPSRPVPLYPQHRRWPVSRPAFPSSLGGSPFSGLPRVALL